MKSSKKKGKREETQLSTSSKITFSPYKQPEEEMIASPNKENQRPLKFLQQTKLAIQAPMNEVKFKQDMVLEECKAERVPLQSLLMNFSGSSILVPNDATRNGISVNCSQIMGKVSKLFCFKLFPSISSLTSVSCKLGNSISVPNDATRNGISVKCSQIMRKSNFAGDGKRRWTSLVGKESRKSLKLLQGLKGTHLVIPKMASEVIHCGLQQCADSFALHSPEAAFNSLVVVPVSYAWLNALIVALAKSCAASASASAF
ncbi:hypothetical protein DKX38_026953 [Salix brachista]|uniref:Uncharacterized protein n=1 Tax=Salix brachista TaxID=2182728 RepID=A0A5N5JG31_9ROSI|nr:hypothetical protein DKX38_026953 [Salix brachista]